MKRIQCLIVSLLVSLVMFFAIVSCNSSRTAVSCPDISLKKNDFRGHRRVKNTSILLTHKTLKYHSRQRSAKIRREDSQPGVPVIAAAMDSQISKVEFNSSLLASTNNALPLVSGKPFRSPGNDKNRSYTGLGSVQEARCDTIVLKNRAKIIGKVEEIGQIELKYRKCNNLAGPLYSVLKSDVSRILYSNGTSDLFGPSETYIENQNYDPNPNLSFDNDVPARQEGLGLAGFFAGLLGLFIASIPLGTVAVVFGGISLSRVNREPRRYKGRGLAIASIVIGLIDVLAMLFLLGSV